MSTAAFGRPAQPVIWRHPEWWVMLLSVISWLALLGVWFASQAPGTPHAHNHHPATSAIFDANAYGHWALMIPAMMYPFLIGHLRLTAVRSLWPRRDRAMALFLAGYTAPWLVFGLLAVPLARAGGVALWLALAAAWQVTPWKAFGELACHRTHPLAARGWRADRDCLQYGASNAAYCLLTCGALMTACAAAHGQAASMPVLTALLFVERMPRPMDSAYARRRRRAATAAAFALAAAAVYLFGI
jgi:hypothetical protein